MKNVFFFSGFVSKGKSIYECALPEYLRKAGKNKIFLPEELIAAGVDLATIFDNRGERVFSEQEVLNLRISQAQASPVIRDGTVGYELPTPESLMQESWCKANNMEPVLLQEEFVAFPKMTQASRSAPAQPQELPSPDLTPAMIHHPEISAKEKRTELVYDSALTRENTTLPVQIYRYLRNRYCFRLYKGEVYLFKENLGYYVRQSSSDIDFLINRDFSVQIEKTGHSWAYKEAQEFLKRDAALAIEDAYLLKPDFWVFQDLVVNVLTGETFPNDGRFFVRSALQCHYLPGAKSPLFDDYLSATTADDPALYERIWEVIGYLLSTDTRGKVFFALIGKKDTGKSLFANVLMDIIGKDSISGLSASDFAGRFDVSELNGRHANFCMDLPDKPLPPDAVGKIKSITGGDLIRSDVKYKEAIRFVPTARLLFGSNAMIRTEVQDLAFNDRMIVVPFRYPVPKEKQDFQLREKLFAEREGICVKAMEAYRKLRSNSYRFTSICFADTCDGSCIVDYGKTIERFTDVYCQFTGNDTDRVASESLSNAFAEFCANLDIPPLSADAFIKKFQKLNGARTEKKKLRINGRSVNGFSGLRLDR